MLAGHAPVRVKPRGTGIVVTDFPVSPYFPIRMVSIQEIQNTLDPINSTSGPFCPTSRSI